MTTCETTVDLTPWAVGRHRARRNDWQWERPAALVLAVLLDVARLIFNLAVDVAVCAVVFAVVLLAGSALVDLILWRR